MITLSRTLVSAIVFGTCLYGQVPDSIYVGKIIAPLHYGMTNKEVQRIVLGDGRYETPGQDWDSPNVLVSVFQKNDPELIATLGFNDKKQLDSVGRTWVHTAQRSAVDSFATLMKLLNDAYQADTRPFLDVKTIDTPDRFQQWVVIYFRDGSKTRTITFSVARVSGATPDVMVDEDVSIVPARDSPKN